MATLLTRTLALDHSIIMPLLTNIQCREWNDVLRHSVEDGPNVPLTSITTGYMSDSPLYDDTSVDIVLTETTLRYAAPRVLVMPSHIQQQLLDEIVQYESVHVIDTLPITVDCGYAAFIGMKTVPNKQHGL